MSNRLFPVHGADLGLRRALLSPLADQSAEEVSFMEVAPENWIGIGGALGCQFRAFTERYPFASTTVCPCLSADRLAPLDKVFLRQLRLFFRGVQNPMLQRTPGLLTDGGHLSRRAHGSGRAPGRIGGRGT